MEDFEQVVLLVAAVQGLLLSVALFLSGWKKHKPAVYLAVVLFVFAIELLNAWAMGIGYHGRKGVFPFWTLGSYLLLPPALWFFLHMNRKAVPAPGKKERLLFLPAFFEILAELVSYYTGRDGFFSFLGTGAWLLLTEYLPILATTCVLVWMTFMMGREGTQNVTGTRFKRQRWILVIFMVLLMFWITDAIFKIGVYRIIEAMLSIVLLGMGYIVYFSPAFFEAPALERQRNLDQFVAYDEKQSMGMLKVLFEKDKVFLRPRLTLEEISSETGLPSRYISYLINHVYQCNFNQFVNRHRVEEVLRRMEDPRNNIKTLLGIALDSGFSSKSSFNAAFKTVTGRAPSTFLKER